MNRTEPLSAAVVVAEGWDGHVPVLLSPIGARRLTDEIRHHLGSALAKLARAREGQADQVLGYSSWYLYVETEFGNLTELRLSVTERRALVESMRADDLSVRQIAGRLGVSVGTVHGDLPATRERAADVVPIREPDPDPYAGMSRADEVVARVAAQGDRGLTSRELELDTDYHHGVSSGALSRVARQHRIRADGRFRQGWTVYVTDAG